MLQGIEAGELGKWLRVVMANSAPGAHQQVVPSKFADYLVNLRVAQMDATGRLVITEKGRLALRMESPDALHKQVDPDDVVAEAPEDEALDDATQASGARTDKLAPYDGDDDDHDDGGHDHRR